MWIIFTTELDILIQKEIKLKIDATLFSLLDYGLINLLTKFWYGKEIILILKHKTM